MNRFLLPVTVAFSASSLLLVDSAIKGAALLVFASLVVLMLRRDSAATRHLVWLVAIVAMLFVPALCALLPQWRVLPEWAVLSTDRNAIDTVAVNGSDVIDGRYAARETDVSHQASFPSAIELTERATQPSLVRTAPPVGVDIPIPAKAEKSMVTLWTVNLPFVWIVGFLLLLVRLLAARLLLWQVEGKASVVPHGERQGVSPPCSLIPHVYAANAVGIQRIIDTLIAAKTQLAIRHHITLLIHPDKTIPVVWGIIRHRLLLPMVALQWSDEQLRSVLLHELAHIKRRDTLGQLLAQIACALHWFNPLVWFAAWRLHVERERACDDLVLASGVRASAYAEHLLSVATKLSSSPWIQACGLAMARSSSLHGRLAAVLSEKRNRRSVSTSVMAVCVLLAATILIPVAMLGAVDENQPAQAATPATEDSATVTATANEESAMKLPPGMEEHLDWSKPVNGLRAAVRIRTMDSPGNMGRERKIFVVIQNTSDKPIRFCDTAIQETDVPAADTEGRTLYLEDNGEILMGIQRAVSMRIDLVLQPRDILSFDMFDDEKASEQGHKSGDVFAEGIVKLPSRALFAELNIIHAPDGAWTGTLKTPSTRGAFAADGPMPKSKEGQALFRYCVDHARLNDQIPGGLIGRLHEKVLEFISLNDGDQFGDPYAKKMQPLVARFEQTGDWNQVDVVALFDDIAVVTTIPLDTTLEQIRERTLQRGQRLPASFEKANWGETLPGGLRMAWVLEPGAEKYHLGSSLRSRVLIHNSGKEPVAFVTRSFHQPAHKSSKVDGSAIQMESTYWTTIGRPEPYRLHPGEYCEVHAPGIGIGPRNNDDEDWANIRPGSWILANEDDEIVFQPGAVMLSGDHNEQVNPNWWLEFIKERVNRDAPLPADPKEREVILFRVVQDLFGNSPSPEEADAFYSDMSPEAVDNFAQRLSKRSWLTSVAGPIQGGETKFRVLPEDPDAATRIRVATNPGHYNLGENLRFVVMRRAIGERIVNEANITWYPDGQNSKSHNVPLPDGYDTWGAAWSPGSTLLWLQQKNGTHNYDFTDPAEVKEAAVEPDKVPAPIRDAFPAVRPTPETSAKPKPAAAAPATQANDEGGEQSPSVDLKPVDPKHEYARSLFSKWKANARTDGKIPGALIGYVAKTLDDFAKQYRNEATPQLAAIRSKFDASHDWKQADAVALLDLVTAISTAPVSWAETPLEFLEMRALQAGKPLPVELQSAAWGVPAENGLRAAWLLEPTAEQYPLGLVLKARVLFHNSGKNPVVFKTETWHQDDRHSATDTKDNEIKVGSTWYTGITPMATYRLEPGDYVEVRGHGIGIGAGEYKEELSIGSVGAWIEAKEGDDVRFSSLVDASFEGWTRPDDPKDPAELRKVVVANRVEQEAPLPASPADREQLLRRVTQDLFGEPPQQGELHDFLIDNSPDALGRLIERLQNKARIEPFVGKLTTGESKFRVIAADPNAAKAPRTANNPGRYVLGDTAHLLVSQRTEGGNRTNKATIAFLSPDPKVASPHKSHEITLSDEPESYAFVWERGTGVLWLITKGLVRSYDFTNPSQVQETRFEPGSMVNIPEHLHEALGESRSLLNPTAER